MKVAVLGFVGRMGSEVVRAVAEAPDMEYVGGADPAAGSAAAAGSVVSATSVSDLLRDVRPDVAVDFSVPAAVYSNCLALLEAGVHCVVGATGLTADERTLLGEVAATNSVGIVVAPNFSVGAVIMMQLARIAAPHFEKAEIIEIHHDRKVDAPSGTSLMTAELISAAREADAPASDQQPSRGHPAGSVRLHSVRLPGYTAHQEVLFGNEGEALTIRHDTFDRKSFMPGVLLAVRQIGRTVGLTYGLEHFLMSDNS